jgi:hypothetical protein
MVLPILLNFGGFSHLPSKLGIPGTGNLISGYQGIVFAYLGKLKRISSEKYDSLTLRRGQIQASESIEPAV